jgi:hypothetical protein
LDVPVQTRHFCASLKNAKNAISRNFLIFREFSKNQIVQTSQVQNGPFVRRSKNIRKLIFSKIFAIFEI